MSQDADVQVWPSNLIEYRRRLLEARIIKGHVMSEIDTHETGAAPDSPDSTHNQAERELPPAAQRALAEAEARRVAQAEAEKTSAARSKEIGGAAGPDPVRYGDWEKGGIASDF